VRRTKELLMFFEIERDIFLDGLSKTVPITEKRSPLPILSHILMRADEDKLVLTATDLEVGLQMTSGCQVKESGSLTVPSKKIYEIMRELPSGQITIEPMEANRIRILSGQSVFELAGMDASDFPAWPALEEVKTVSVPSDKLMHMVEKTLFASSNDESRFNLNGILFEEYEDKIRLVATDGHRLAMIDEPLDVSLGSKKLVPKKGLLEMKRVLESLDEEVQLGFEQKNIVMQTKRFCMTIRLIEGDYPDYRKVIPEKGAFEAKVNRLNLIQILRRVAILTSERNKGITVKVGAGKMEIKAVHPDLGTAKDEVDIEYDGEELLMIINVVYLIEGLGVLDTETVCFEFSEEGSPIIIRPEPESNHFNLVMPMRQ
jgi:DNA polymerase III subunit beta